MMHGPEFCLFVHREMDNSYSGMEWRFTEPQFTQSVSDITA